VNIRLASSEADVCAYENMRISSPIFRFGTRFCVCTHEEWQRCGFRRVGPSPFTMRLTFGGLSSPNLGFIYPSLGVYLVSVQGFIFPPFRSLFTYRFGDKLGDKLLNGGVDKLLNDEYKNP